MTGTMVLPLLLAGAIVSQITDPASSPVLREGQTYQFRGRCPEGHACGWTLATGHDATSSITVDGLYTAPSKVAVHGRLGGCALGPHNWVYNVRVDAATSGLKPYPNSAEQIALMMSTANGSAYKGLHGSGGGTTNVVSNSSPLTPMHGTQSSAQHWNGSYRLETPAIAPYGSRTDPLAAVQAGWRSLFGDNRYSGVNRDSCDVLEVYLPYGTDLTTIQTAAGVPFGGMSYYNSMEWLNGDGLKGPGSGGSTAGGTWLAPIQLSVVELARIADQVGAGGDLGHVLAMTLPNTAIAPHTANGGLGHVWPATANGWVGTGNILYGTRFRLKPEFVASYNPALDSANPRVQAMVMILLRTLERYGIMLMDGTTPFDAFGLHTRADGYADVDYSSALSIVAKSPNLASNWTNASTWTPAKSVIANLEAVDESSLMVSPLSNLVLAAYAKPERVVYKDLTAGVDLDTRDIVVNPPTVGTLRSRINIVGGASVNLRPMAWATGLANNDALSWRIVSGPGAVTNAGVYTPPANLAAPELVKVRAAAVEDASVYTDFRVVAYPPVRDKLCLRAANAPNATGAGCTWWGQTTDGTVIAISGNAGGGYLGSNPDGLYPNFAYATGAAGDWTFGLFVPNGRYRVTTLAFTGASYGRSCSTADEHCNPSHLTQIELNNAVSLPAAHWFALAGNANWAGAHVSGAVQVTNGQLTYAMRRVGPGEMYPYLSSIVIEPQPEPSTGGAVRIGGHASVRGSGKIL